jgi:cell division ATPase FtsA
MARLYKVGDYGEMKLGEFRKNIMQYTRNNLRSIIRDSDPEIVEIAQDELDRRGEERKKGGLIDKPLGPGGKKKKKKGKK